MIVVCGEALIDLVPRRCGDEMGYVARRGGSPYNVAIGLARLGIPTGYLGRLSRDWFGRMLRDGLEADGVDLRFAREGDELSTLAVVNAPPGQEPEFAFHGHGAADALISPDELPDAFPEDVRALHFGSISLVREPGASTFEALMRREQGRRLLSLDPNVRASLIPDRAAYTARLEGWIALMDLVKVSRADLEWLYPGTPVADAAGRWLASGPALVAVTMGTDGARAFTASGSGAAPGVSVTVADTVGAGDAFTSGLLAWLSDHSLLERDALGELPPDQLGEALAFANRVAALACTRSGAEPPRRSELGRAGAA
jgi:fructokinase